MPNRLIWEIAEDIDKEYDNLPESAIPFIDKLLALNKLEDSYEGQDAYSIIFQFLLCAIDWRGPIASKVKRELNQIIGKK
jgi:hypothetical protein